MDEIEKNTSEDTGALQNNDAVYRISAFRYHETLQNIMETDVYCCRPDDEIHKVAEEMAKRRISSVIITDEKRRPLGIVTERDMVRKVVADSEHSKFGRNISEIMTPHPVCLPPDGTLFDALSMLSRYTIKHLPVVRSNRVVGLITLRKIMKIRYSEPMVIIGQLEKAELIADYKNIKDDLIYLAKERLASNTDPVDITTMLSLVNSGIHKRLLKKTIEDFGTPAPVDFCFFVTGSHGRMENLLFPDQDFCIIIDDYPESRHKEIDNYFHEISLKFSEYLNEVGFPYCSGKIMGQNPEWRKRISEWHSFVSGIFLKPGPYTVRYLTLIFDSAFLFGKRSLFDRYISHAFNEIAQNHNIIRQMHTDEEGKHKVPLGLFNTFITEKQREHKGEINMKRSGLLFIIEAARILALKHGIRETSTLCRIQALVDKGVIQVDDSEYFDNAYRVILYHTLNAQVDNYLEKDTNDYYLTPRKLSDRNQEILKQAFKAISDLQEIVGSEFGELIL
ncbi:MAG: putative nucleotidyltransferase substrate binding domain-containing protein [Nitrospirota bacterium]